MKTKQEKYFQITAKTVCVCGWTVKARSLAEARIIANSGPEWGDLDFDEPENFEVINIDLKR